MLVVSVLHCGLAYARSLAHAYLWKVKKTRCAALQLCSPCSPAMGFGFARPTCSSNTSPENLIQRSLMIVIVQKKCLVTCNASEIACDALLFDAEPHAHMFARSRSKVCGLKGLDTAWKLGLKARLQWRVRRSQMVMWQGAMLRKSLRWTSTK